jgi:hypothetical protein
MPCLTLCSACRRVRRLSSSWASSASVACSIHW